MSTVNNIFNVSSGGSVTLSYVIQGSQTEAVRLTPLEKERITTMIEDVAAKSRRVYTRHLEIEEQLQAIAARLHLL